MKLKITTLSENTAGLGAFLGEWVRHPSGADGEPCGRYGAGYWREPAPELQLRDTGAVGNDLGGNDLHDQLD